MPVYRKEDAEVGGYAQVKKALLSFEGDVIRAEDGKWGDGREFFEIECINNVPIEVTEELSMDISEQYSFRVNMSSGQGNFWFDLFLTSAERFKIALPDGLVGKRILWKKAAYEANDPQYNKTDFIIDSVKAVAKAAPRVVATHAVQVATLESAEVANESEGTTDPMELALNLAVGKTETQFKSAISLHPAFVDSPLLSMAKSGLITKTLIEEGKLVEVKEGNKTIYKRPE